MLLDLSKVTRAIIAVLREQIRRSPAWLPRANPPNVSPLPPDVLPGGALGVYLYHIVEAAHLKSQLPPGNDVPPVRFTPMGLELHYQITARGDQEGDNATFFEQLLLGCAAKALHDYPFVDDDTVINGTAILNSVGLDQAGNKMRICLQPMPFDEATNFWNAASLAPRLALYYQVSVILLEPEKVRTTRGRVLSYGIQTFVGGAPWLDGSFNLLAFAFPGQPERVLEVRPAQVSVGDRVWFTGYNLIGDQVSLIVRSGRWPVTVEADPSWGVTGTASEVQAVVRPFIGGLEVLPGIYSAMVRVTERRTLPDGTTRLFPQTSNETPFSISPTISNITLPNAQGDVTVTGAVFKHAEILPGGFELFVAGDRYDEHDPATGPNLAPGEYEILDATHVHLVLRPLPTGPAALRINVLGVDSPPNWIAVP
jgi:hypothetical protein